MRVLQVCSYSWDAVGGVQEHVRQLTRQLRRRGHKVLVLAPGARQTSNAALRTVAPVRTIRWNGSAVPISFGPHVSRAVRETLRVFRPELVHVHEPYALSIAPFALLHARVPVVATYHAHRQGAVAVFLGHVCPRILGFAGLRPDCRVAVSDIAAAGIVGPAHIIPNGVDLERFATARPAPLPAGRTIAFIHRLEPRKGFGIALQAFELVADRFADARLLVVGDGTERSLLDSLPAPLRGRVHAIARCQADALPSYYKAADLFIAPATGRESFGVVLLEAMAAGLPVVASDIAGYREVVRHGHEALLVPPARPDLLAESIGRVLQDEPLAAKLASNGRRRAAAFSWGHVAGRVENLYARVLMGDVAAAVAEPVTQYATTRRLET